MGSGTETVIDSTLNYTVAASATFSAGIDFNTFINYYKTTLGSSFNNQSNLKIYIGNDESFALPFRGSFSAVGFMNNYNFAKVSSWFTSKGIVTASTTFATVRDWGYTYRLTLKLTANIASAYTLNIDSSCVWNGSIPIQTLSSYNTSTNNYELDFIQFNIDFPEPCTFASNNYTTTLLDVKTYIYFRYLSDGSYVNPTTFTTTTSPSSNGTVVPGAGWKTTRYEVVNGMIIYPPSNLDTNTTINDLVMGIIVEHKNNNPTAAWNFTPVRIRSLEVASKLLNTETTKWKNGFGTKFANLVYPYTHRTADSSTVFNYKDKNPYKIYKSDLPYLYMTRNSGISVLSGYSNGVSDSRGIMIPVNEKAEASYSLSAMQMFLRYEAATFPATETKIFSLVSSGLTVDFYMIATTTAATRARIYAKNGANEYTNVKYYLNGVEVAYPVLEISEWSNVGIQFPIPISLNSEVADLRFTGPLMFNNLSYYQYVGSSNNVKYSQSKWNYYVHNSWTNVYNLGATSWNTVLSATVIENYGVDPIETYNSIIGTNKSIIDNTYIGEKALSIKNPSRKLITSAQWQTKTIKPV
jgi:hypothetical protein